MYGRRIFGLVAAAGALLLSGSEDSRSQELLWEHRNLGKAFYENPDTHLQAVDELKAALALNPQSVSDRINYGLALLQAGQTDLAVSELVKAQKQDPTLPYTWFNLGITYKKAGDYDKAIEQLRQTVQLVPKEPVPHYNLAASLKAKGDGEGALAEFLEAERLNPDLAGPHFQLFTLYQRKGDRETAAQQRKLFEEAKKRDEGAAVPEDMEWCFYAELYDPPVDRPAEEPKPQYSDAVVSRNWDRGSRALLIDAEGKGRADLLAWSANRVVLLKAGKEEARDIGLSDLHEIRDVAAGDFDNDGLTDLCVLTAAGASLFHNDHGHFVKSGDYPEGKDATVALWLDFDHDYDLDLLLFGPHPVVLRNAGGKFTAKPDAFPFAAGEALEAVPFAVRGDTAARDAIVSYADHPAIIYRDLLNGAFAADPVPTMPGGVRQLSVEDINHDGLFDIVAYAPDVRVAVNAAKDVNTPAQFQENAKAALFVTQRGALTSIRADFNGHLKEDYAQFAANGDLHLYTDTSAEGHWTSVSIQGVKNLKAAAGATVELKTGAFYGKRIYAGVPLSFPVDGRREIDTVRITWPNGLIQNEPRQKTGQQLKIAEAQRLSGSCPMIFAWNGKAFEFITDVLGVAPLGASSGDGHYFPVNHREYIQIPGSALEPVNGKYRINITEELHEVSYLDQVELLAVDHPRQTEVFVNDKFKSPPYPEFRLFGAEQKIHPVKAVDSNRFDVAPRLKAIDQTYPDSFQQNNAGVAELHTLDLDFGPVAASNRAALVLNGWVDWADGSTFLGQSQDGAGLIFPYMQVKDEQGQWQTVVPDMGIPSGKPKTIAVDLSGKFLSRSREVRIVTNLCVYWDEIFLIESASAPVVLLTPVTASNADLHFRGFSHVVVDPARRQPERFVYSDVKSTSNWNPTPGMYTRYGAVQPLLSKADDKLVVMGSGDELSMEFSAETMPPVKTGWSRDYLLRVEGWAKDSDANTAFSESVAPLPFSSMSAYPYREDEGYPRDAEHRDYVKRYLTRPALQLVRPLKPAYRTD